jgi:pimeloyl-ACP methyl ester carboxylesterase
MHRDPVKIRSLLVPLLLLPALCLAQADYVREKRWADEISPAIVVGDPVYLETAAGRRFLSIWTPGAKAAGAVIVVHGLGVHPDWGLINPLRSQLAEHGYATLSVQMPVASQEVRADRYPALFPEASERLRAAVAFLRGKETGKIAIVSHSMGARMADHFLGQAPDPGIHAWVAIGLSGAFSDPAALRSPVLDLYGEKDFSAVRDSAPGRAVTLRKVRGSGQIEVPGADHFFAGREAELVRQVRLFLDARLRP